MKEILFTRQIHDADKAGRHFDIRLVDGDKAFSWATKKEIPGPGGSIILWQQPDHSAHYALSEEVEIPKGQYGAGKTKLDFVRKATIEHSDKHFTMTTKQGEKYLFKPVPEYGEGAWLFKNLEKNKYLEKIAKSESAKTKLEPHQLRALKKLDRENGVVLDHSTGSGKTAVFLKAIENAQRKNKNGRSLVVAPASLVSNVHQQAKDLGIKIDPERTEVLSYEKAVIDSARLKKINHDLVIFDEAHKLKNTATKRHQELSQVVNRARQRLLATATTKYNHASDISPLVNIAAGKQVMPTGKKEFEKTFVTKQTDQPNILRRIMGARPEIRHHLKHKKYLKDTLNKYVDKYDVRSDPAAADKFPTKSEKVIEVEMSKEQHGMYKYLENKLPWHLRWKVRMNLPLDKKESAHLNSFSSGVRQVSNSVHPFMPNHEGVSPKIKTAVDSLEKAHKGDKNFRGIVYSNYIAGGLQDYSEELKRRKIPHSMFTGAMTAKEKDAAKESYNNGTSPVMLVSSAGTEGLDLKGTKKVQVLEPHFNRSKIKQVIGRGVRYESHAHLPKKERHVEVEHYHSVFPSGLLGKAKTHSIDQYLHHNSESKERLNSQIDELMNEK